MRWLDQVCYLCIGLFVFALGMGCEEDFAWNGSESHLFEQGRAEAPLIYSPGETWDKIKTFSGASEYWSAVQYGKASGRLRYRDINDNNLYRCSATLIGDNTIVTADHCVVDADPAFGISFIPAPFESPLASSQGLLRIQLESLGFRGSALNNAIAEVNANSGSFGDWDCTVQQQDGTRDIAYLTCLGKFVLDQTGSSAALLPGNVFGFVDPKIISPATGTQVTLLSVNTTQKMLDNNETAPLLLLSPNGKVQNNGNTSCNYGPGMSYTGCGGVQGADALSGSSGGIMLRASDGYAYSVHSGSRWIYGQNPERTPVPYTGSAYYNNKNLVAPFSSTVFDYTDTGYVGTLSNNPSMTVTSSFGAQSGTRHIARCASDEALVGLVGSSVLPFLSTTLRLGALGSICNNIYPYLGLKSFRQMYVHTSGASDTGNVSTPSYTSSSRMQLYRYINTVPSIVVLFFIPIPQPQSFAMCPGARSIYSITAAVEDGNVRAVTSIGCRSMNINDPDIEVPIPKDRLGAVPTESTLVTKSCSGARVAMGLDIWVSDGTRDLRLYCRDL